MPLRMGLISFNVPFGSFKTGRVHSLYTERGVGEEDCEEGRSGPGHLDLRKGEDASRGEMETSP